MDNRFLWVLPVLLAACSAYAQNPWVFQNQILPPTPCFDNLPLSKLMLNQSGYIQYVEYVTRVPDITSFTIHYWFYMITSDRNSTMLDYRPTESSNNTLIVQLAQGSPQSWNLILNDQVVSSIPSPLIRTGEWHHVLNSWDSLSGTWSIYLDGAVLGVKTGPSGRGVTIRGGGLATSGQRLNTINGMDRREGLEGWFTLFEMSSRPLLQPYSRETINMVARLARQCDGRAHGEIVSWTRTPRKGYGGIMETPSRQQCGNF